MICKNCDDKKAVVEFKLCLNTVILCESCLYKMQSELNDIVLEFELTNN